MTYENFKTVVENEVLSYLPPKYENAEVCIRTVQKTSETYDGLVVKPPEEEMAPTVNLNRYYERYEEIKDIHTVLEEISNLIVQSVPGINFPDVSKYENIKDKLHLRLSNYGARRGLYENVPHRVLGDMVVTYHVCTEETEDGFYSFAITNDMLAMYGVSEEQLYEDALKSAPALMPAKVADLGAMFGRIDGPRVSVLSNETGYYGAAAMLYPGVLEELSEGKKVYIIPSSVHEALIYHDEMNPLELKAVLLRANSSVVLAEEFLSNHVYMYDGDISVAM